jgi:LacI family transcriptional regulator
MVRRATISDIAKALGVSTTTVHHALHNRSRVSAVTKARVLQMAKELEYQPNLAARRLKSRRPLSVSVNLLRGITTFFDQVVAGIKEEASSLAEGYADVQIRMYAGGGEGEREAFAAALDANVDGIITWSGEPEKIRPLMRLASKSNIPVVCVGTDVPRSGRLAVVSVDTQASGAIAADLLGMTLQGRGKVAITIYEIATMEHAEKLRSFEETLRTFYPGVEMLPPIEDRNLEALAYEKCRDLFFESRDLGGIYITTDASIPVIRAARELGLTNKIVIVATDLFPALINEIKAGTVNATIFQRPRSQGRMAFKVLYDYLSYRKCPPTRLTLMPHLVTRGSLDFACQTLQPLSSPEANDTEPHFELFQGGS